MSLVIKHKETTFGVGDKIRVTQKIAEGDKTRSSIFEGMVIAIKGKGEAKMVTVRKIGIQDIGIERIYPLSSPTIEKIDLVKKGTSGIRHAKLYYIRGKSPREVEKIFSRAKRKDQPSIEKKASKKKK